MQGYSTVEREGIFTFIAGTLRVGSTDEPPSSIAGQGLQHTVLEQLIQLFGFYSQRH